MEAAAKRMGVHHEEWFLQRGDGGTQLVGFMEADDVGKVFEEVRRDSNGFFGWYKDCIQSITGVDLAQGPPAKPEQIAEFRS
jgi:hypothetical protein